MKAVVHCWGENDDGEVGARAKGITPPTRAEGIDDAVGVVVTDEATGATLVDVVAFDNTYSRRCFATKEHHARCNRRWGSDWSAAQERGFYDWSSPAAIDSLAMGDDTLCVRATDGATSCFGSNAHDRLGVKSLAPWSFAPVSIALGEP